jgi:hypothetical protein
MEVYWAAAVGVVHQTGQVGDAFASAGPDRHLQGVEDQRGGHRRGGPPAEDHPGEDVEDERDVDHAVPGGDVDIPRE